MPSSTIDPHYIPAFSIEDVLLDKDTGAPLSGGLVYFYHDNQRGVFKPVYQITGTSGLYTFTQLPNPMTLSSIGTFEDALSNPTVPYFYPYDADLQPDLYYIVVTNSLGVPQFTRQSVPFVPSSGGDSTVASIVTNELSNPQFAEVLFDTTVASVVYTITGATNQAIEIAPDWSIVVTGTGTVTLSQPAPIGSLNVLTNPGTLLGINSSGITTLLLRQRLTGSPNLWGNGNISASFVAKVYDGSAATLKLYYSQSSGTINVTPIVLISAGLPASGIYKFCPGGAAIPLSSSLDDFPDAYIDIYFDIPVGRHIDITSVMVAATGSAIIPELQYEQEPLNRQIDHLFHYYKPELEFKPIPSLLVGWDFPLNPSQFQSPTVNFSVTTTPQYVWDQTIAATSSVTMNAIRNTVTGGLQATSSAGTQAIFYLQYLTDGQAKEILGTPLSVNVSGFRTQAGGTATVKVYLYRGSAAAVVPVLPLTIGGATPIDSAGVFTLNAVAAQGLNWTLIPRGHLGQAHGDLSTVSTLDYTTLNDVVDLKFSGWEEVTTANIADTDKFAIVVTVSCPTVATVFTIDSISLVKGLIPTRPGAQTSDEVLQECQYYWEKSYNSGVYAGQAGGGSTVPIVNHIQTTTSAGHSNILYGETFGYRFNTVKRASPAMKFYTPTAGTPDSVEFGILRNGGYVAVGGGGSGSNPQIAGIAGWGVSISTKGIYALCGITTTLLIDTGATAGNAGDEGLMVYHYVADARLGIV